MYFIVLTTAATVNVHGGGRIETAQQAAEALRPVAGQGAFLLFTLGIVGTGFLSVPVLAGSTAFAIEKPPVGTALCRPLYALRRS